MSQRRLAGITVSDEGEALRISIPPARDWEILFVVLWLAFWTSIGVQALRTLIHQSLSSWPTWIFGWAFGELLGSYAILHNVGGSEIIVANSEALRRTRKIFGLGWSNTYLVREIGNLRFQRGGGNRRPSRIAFDYGARTITFGKGIEEAEACELMRRIQQRCAIADGSG